MNTSSSFLIRTGLCLLACVFLANCSSSTSTPSTTIPASGTAVMVIDGKTISGLSCSLVTDTFSTSPLITYKTLQVMGKDGASDSVFMEVINVNAAASGSFPLSVRGIGGVSLYNNGVNTDSSATLILRGNASAPSAYGIAAAQSYQKVASNSLSVSGPFYYYKNWIDTAPTSTVQVSLQASY